MWFANFFSGLGDQLYAFAIPWFLLGAGYGPSAISFVRAAEFLGLITYGFFAGSIVKRLGARRSVMLAACLSAVTLILLYLNLRITGALLLFVATVSITVSCMNRTTSVVWQSSLPHLVARSELPIANSALSTSNTLVSLFGAGLAGLLVALLGEQNLLLINALSFLTLLLPAASLPVLTDGTAGSGSVLMENRRAWQQILNGKGLLSSTLIITMMNFMLASVSLLVIYRLKEHYGATAASAGLTLMGSGVGALFGALLAPRMYRWLSMEWLPYVTFGFVSVCMIGLALANTWWLMAAAMTGISLFTVIGNVAYQTLRQRAVSRNDLPNVVSLTSMIMKTSAPLGLVVIGMLLNTWTVQAVQIMLGSFTLLTLVLSALANRTLCGTPLMNRAASKGE